MTSNCKWLGMPECDKKIQIMIVFKQKYTKSLNQTCYLFSLASRIND